MKIGVLIHMTDNIDADFAHVKELGFDNCQLACWKEARMTDENAEKIKEATAKYGIEITAFWCGWSGPVVWDFYSGPLTLGIVPEAYREMRIRELKVGADFANKFGVKNVITHAGFIPESPLSEEFPRSLRQLRTSLFTSRKTDRTSSSRQDRKLPLHLRDLFSTPLQETSV